MKKRIITTENLEEDLKIENHLRPQLLEDYVGQEKIKEKDNGKVCLMKNSRCVPTLGAVVTPF